jgi:hypothetical protein
LTTAQKTQNNELFISPTLKMDFFGEKAVLEEAN